MFHELVATVDGSPRADQRLEQPVELCVAEQARVKIVAAGVPFPDVADVASSATSEAEARQ
ncbi:MAG TPA: hypothetical protein VG010_04735 [Solirubrobacteraceae bacterium]|jgi:hypothetical protein|nr:hypothetical protein [Solirubrobacteraceae bacterium]